MSGGMPMPGGWTMSMAWMRMAGQSWAGAAATFMGMWLLMMVAMMMPSLTPMLAGYRRSVRPPGTGGLGVLTLLVAAGYFAVWAASGAAVYPLGVAVAAAEMQWPAVAARAPIAAGLALLLAGGLQLSAWKARQLGRCRDDCRCGPPLEPDAGTAWRHGLRLGVHCGLCCSGLIAILLVTGVMDLRPMAAVAAAISAERLAPWPERVARAAGLLALAAGLLVVLRALDAA